MEEFFEMLRRVTSSPYHDQMVRFVKPLKDYFGINHFWYYRVSRNGHYTYVGTHSEWNEFCFENHLVGQFPCLRHPDLIKSGIDLMKNTTDQDYQKVLNSAWDNFGVNFNLNLVSKTQEGIEAFGFASNTQNPKTDEILINELPLLTHFTRSFRLRHPKLFELVHDNQVNFSSYLGPKFHEGEKISHHSQGRDVFLKKMGFVPSFELSPREKDVLGLLASGYPSPYIAKQLSLARRTVENYVATIKSKLFCESKVELIQRAKEFASIGYIRSEL